MTALSPACATGVGVNSGARVEFSKVAVTPLPAAKAEPVPAHCTAPLGLDTKRGMESWGERMAIARFWKTEYGHQHRPSGFRLGVNFFIGGGSADPQPPFDFVLVLVRHAASNSAGVTYPNDE